MNQNEEDEGEVDNNGNAREVLERQCGRLARQVRALKNSLDLRKELLEARELQVKELIVKLKGFESELSLLRERRAEQGRRLDSAEQNMADLLDQLKRNRLEASAAKVDYEAKLSGVATELAETKLTLMMRTEEKAELETKLRALETMPRPTVATTHTIIETRESDPGSEVVRGLEGQLAFVLEKNRSMAYQMSLLNTLFTETEGTPIDFERIKAIGDIVRESQINTNIGPETTDPEVGGQECRTQLDVTRIIDRLDALDEGNPVMEVPGVESCYKSSDTGGGGPKLVLSVSRTFIKLKDLILEKESLKKEIDGLKELNSKLETKVDTQERRLYRVTLELNKTWSLVSKLKAQHGQLHSSKAVQRCELGEKRKLLEKLKSDLKSSREKWVRARVKNSESQIEWQSIRDEFTRRRTEGVTSPESAFEEESPGSHDLPLVPITAEEAKDDTFVADLAEEIDDIEAAAEEAEEEDDVVEIDGSEVSWEELVNRRASRLRVLEEQCRCLYNKLQASTARNTELASKLADLHDHYGPEAGPPTEPEPGETETGFVGASESSDDTAYASGVAGTAEDDLTEVPSDADSEVILQGAEEEAPELDPGVTRLVRRLSAPLPGADCSRTEELLAEIRSYIVGDEEEGKDPLTPGAPNHVGLLPDTPEEADEEERRSRSSPTADLNALARLLIQQLPKRLEVLKAENTELRAEASQARTELQEREDRLRDKVAQEMELRNELELKQKVIEELTNKIQVATENYETINREHGRMAEYFKMKMLERDIQEQRKLAKSRNAKNCTKCTKKFTIFKRKFNCSVCGHSFCTDCLIQEPSVTPASSSRKQKKVRVCGSCTERRRQLDAVVIESIN